MRKHYALVLGLLIALTAIALYAGGCRAKTEQQAAATGDSPLFPAGTEATAVQEDASAETAQKDDNAPPVATHKLTIATKKGDIVVELYGKDAPVTVNHIVGLVQKKFYDGLTFHRVELDPSFQLIQGGDPNGNGTGGSGQEIPLEISPKLRHWEGAIAMARSNDPNSADSQFYICNVAIPQLDDQYAVFGKVIKGLDVSKKIAVGDKMLKVTVETLPAAK